MSGKTRQKTYFVIARNKRAEATLPQQKTSSECFLQEVACEEQDRNAVYCERSVAIPFGFGDCFVISFLAKTLVVIAKNASAFCGNLFQGLLRRIRSS